MNPTPPLAQRWALHSRLRAALQQRWRAWWAARLAPTDHLSLNQRNVYIVPSSAALWLGLTLLVLLLASINDRLNLGYLFTFLLAGSLVAAMHAAHANLRGLCVQVLQIEPVFAGQRGALHVDVHNPSRRARWSVGLRVQGEASTLWFDLPAQSSQRLQLYVPAPTRGLHPLALLELHTRHPLGAFHVWCPWRVASPRLVYPALPAQAAPPYPDAADPRALRPPASIAHRPAPSAGEDWTWRDYRAGDPLRQIDWKKSARHPQWISRCTPPAPRNAARVLCLADTGLSEREAQLSRLCAWVLRAHAQSEAVGLQLGTQVWPALAGDAQRDRLLRALALFD